MEKNCINKTIHRLLCFVPLLLLAVGCHRDQVQVYQVSQDQDQSSPPAAAPSTNSADSSLPPGHPDMASSGNPSMPSGVVSPDTSAAPLTWTTPAGWTQVLPSEMRVASFKITDASGKQADVSIVPLSGLGGGDFANVNRWRGQVGLQDAPDDELQSETENVAAGGQPAALYDIAGKDKTTGQSSRILGAIQHRDSTSWFFKMTGDADLVEKQKPAFLDFLKTLSFSSPSAQSQLPPVEIGSSDQQTLPPGHPPIDGMSPPAAASPVSHDGQPNWQVPAGWREVNGGSFLIAKFMLSGDGGAAATVNVSSSAGDGGGLAPNVNRWRGQLGLPPQDEISTVTFTVAGGQAQMVDFSGTNAETGKPAEIAAVVVTQSDRTWFYKLMGDPGLVAGQKDAFTAFVKGVKY